MADKIQPVQYLRYPGYGESVPLYDGDVFRNISQLPSISAIHMKFLSKHGPYTNFIDREGTKYNIHDQWLAHHTLSRLIPDACYHILRNRKITGASYSIVKCTGKKK